MVAAVQSGELRNVWQRSSEKLYGVNARQDLRRGRGGVWLSGTLAGISPVFGRAKTVSFAERT